MDALCKRSSVHRDVDKKEAHVQMQRHVCVACLQYAYVCSPAAFVSTKANVVEPWSLQEAVCHK